jgi:UDP:flavonoid glycosyltransferase YjiC (YdhE family)
MSKILVVTWDGGGNVPPALGIAAELNTRGHEICVMGNPAQAQQVQNAGFQFVGYETARPFRSTDSNSVFGYIALFGDRAMGRDVVAEIDRQHTDLVIFDCMLFGPIEAVARTATPYVVLEHLYDGYFARNWLHGPMGLGLALKRVRTQQLLDHAALRIVATLPELDPGSSDRRPANMKYIGPVVSGTPAAATEPTVLVSLSTFNFPGQTRTMQNILDALATVPARGIVTMGPVIHRTDLTAPSNVELHEWIPHSDVMPNVSLVVGHGGHATTMQALAHDLPLIVMPMHPMLDQKMVGKSVEAAGAGQLLPKKAKPAQIAQSIRRLLQDGPQRQTAARLGRAIRDSKGAQSGADLIEETLKTVTAPRL